MDFEEDYINNDDELLTIDEDELALLEQIHPSYGLIPKFFDAPPRSGDKVQQMLHMEAHGLKLQKEAMELPNADELDKLWESLQKHVTQTTSDNQNFIDISSFLAMTSGLDAKFRKFINVGIFFDLLSKSAIEEKLNIMSIYNKTIQGIKQARGRLCLCHYDNFGFGYLKESDLENYFGDMIPSWRQVSTYVHPSFEKFYVYALVKIVFFYMDTLHTGRVCINRIASSCLLMKKRKNCFSMPAILNMYQVYLSLDTDRNGLLSKQEMSKYKAGVLTNIFLDRAFEVCRTKHGQMDYKTFVEFFLALGCRKSLAGLRYIFRILDFQQQGFLTAETLLYFFNETQDGNKSKIKFQDFKNKIFDMVNPKDPLKITLKDLIKCQQGDTVVSLLIEFHKYLAVDDPYI